MSYEVRYQSPTGHHAEVVEDVRDNEHAVHEFHRCHQGEHGVRVTGVVPIHEG
jgi:hypothetical protein